MELSGPPGFNSLVDKTAAGYTTSSKTAKLRVRFPFSSSIADLNADSRNLQGDVRATRQTVSEWTAAIDFDQLATLIDPSNFEARLNCAAVRLQLANPDTEFAQSVFSPHLMSSSLMV